jgi:transcriptional regulator with XRE-family HTH domain
VDRDLSFGRLLKRLRKARDLTQEALAQQAYCAVDTIKKIEQGLQRLSATPLSRASRPRSLAARRSWPRSTPCSPTL